MKGYYQQFFNRKNALLAKIKYDYYADLEARITGYCNQRDKENMEYVGNVRNQLESIRAHISLINVITEEDYVVAMQKLDKLEAALINWLAVYYKINPKAKSKLNPFVL